MKKHYLRIQAFSLIAMVAMLCCFTAEAALPNESPLVAEATELLDTYYGNQKNLAKAAELIERAYRNNPSDANAFVQAARLTAMGGALTFGRFKGDTVEHYGALLDKAISLNKKNQKAHILKAEVFKIQKRPADQFAELELAKALGDNDPWLKIGYAVYFDETNATRQSFVAYEEVERRGPGSTASDRKAYISALTALSNFEIKGQSGLDRIRKYAALALKERYPTDAWTPLEFAETFVDNQSFDDAILYAREALKTMDFGAAKLTLAASLYAKAAQLKLQGGDPKQIAGFVNEAKGFKFSKNTVFEYLLVRRGTDGSLRVLASTLNTIIQ
jgi:tetratricopeptide (TPR) repeat protein